MKGAFSLTIKREESLRRLGSRQQRMFGGVIVVSTTEAVGGPSRHITSTLANCDYSTVEDSFNDYNRLAVLEIVLDFCYTALIDVLKSGTIAD